MDENPRVTLTTAGTVMSLTGGSGVLGRSERDVAIKYRAYFILQRPCAKATVLIG